MKLLKNLLIGSVTNWNGESKELVKTFEEETHTFIDPKKQLEKE